MAKEIKRLNINLPKELDNRVSQYAERMTLNKTSAIIVLLQQALDNQKMISDVSELLDYVKQLEDSKTEKSEQ